MKKSIIYLMILSLSPFWLTAQKAITLEDIWQKGTFRTKGVPGFNFLNDGKHYSTQEGKKIVKKDLTTGQTAGTIYESDLAFDSYAFNSNESQILLATQSVGIYRRSEAAFYKLWANNALTDLYPTAKQVNPTFNDAGTHIAFTSNNNLFIKDLQNNKLTQVTKDGLKNKIINGQCDWVYEEEFSFTRAFEWSPDGSKVAFLRFDESAVPEFTMQLYNNGMYPEPETFKYPKVGEKNAVVTVWLYDLKKKKLMPIQTGVAEYFPRLKWTPNNELLVFKLNRLQNDLVVLKADTKTGKTAPFFTETNKCFVDIDLNDGLYFLNDGRFLRTSEKDGWNHIYLYAKDGKETAQLTKGDWEVRQIYGVDAAKGLVYFQASKNDPANKEVYALHIDTRAERAIAVEKGINNADFSKNYDYYVLTHSTINTPPTIRVFQNDGKEVRLIEDNKSAAARQKEYNTAEITFETITTAEGIDLKAWVMKPTNFDPNKRYPVLMTQYSGPNSQQVLNQWKGADYWWYQMLTQKGYIVVCVDPRGTGGRGEAFRKITYKQLGHYEVIDQIGAARALSALPYIDGSRIGIFGWSYGGYMSSSCILKGNDVFKAAIAIAPVTNWKWYDSVYTERYMQTESDNPSGYKDNSPVYFADRLKGNFLICHGMADDNVHFQHTVEMANALIKANKQFDTYFYPNLNHGIGARLHLYTKMTQFIMEKL